MSTQNDFLPFAAAGGANVLDQAAYAAASDTATGFVAGTASSAAANKTLRQGSLMASMLARFIVTEIDEPVVDDGTTDTILANFIASIIAIAEAYGGDMLKAQNLSGLENYVTARTNLGLGTAAVANTGTSSANVPTIAQADARYAKLTGASFTGPINGTTSAWSGMLTGVASNWSGALTGTSGSFSGSLSCASLTSSGAVVGLSFNTTSSRRFKRDIQSLSGVEALALLDTIDAVRYTSNKDGTEHFGVIAEQLDYGPLAFAVQHDSDGNAMSVDYQSLFTVAMAGVRELRGQFYALEARLSAIEQRG